MATTVPVTLDTLITIKVSIEGSNRKFKVPMRDLGASVLPGLLRQLLNIPANQGVVFERFSDSAGAYITLDAENPQVYKTLFRAAKAKLKLRLRATVVNPNEKETSSAPSVPQNAPQTAIPVLLPLRAAPVVPPQPQSEAKPQPVAQTTPAPATTGTIPLHPYARHPAFHKTNMRPAPAVPSPKPSDTEKLADTEGEAPVPRTFSSFMSRDSPARQSFLNHLADIQRERELALRMKEAPAPAGPLCSWSVYCNVCDKPMADEHYHCSICDDGDYDLCSNCVAEGHHCPGEGHWLIKRFVKSGKVINSTTERVGPKVKPEPEAEKEIPGAFIDRKAEEPEEPELEESRTCNACIEVLPESSFVSCTECYDYDLCMSCHVGARHGHHPGHTFKPAVDGTAIGPLAEFLCAPGRNVRHNAICDSCDKYIYGVRHKCLDCPDWDFCSECIKEADTKHPLHRFVPIYEPLAKSRMHASRHFGIYCDGPLCKEKMNQSYIEGVRYKCTICYDTDFCANCETHTSNRHNRTHPLIMFKTPVRNVTVTTMSEDKQGSRVSNLGDAKKGLAAESSGSPPAITVRNIVDVKPTEDMSAKSVKEKIQIKDLLAEPIKEKIKVEDLLTSSKPTSPNIEETNKETNTPAKVPSTELNAHFIRDTICDGTKMPANELFSQVWTLRNPGPYAWPAGCCVKYVGGDNMLNVNNNHPSTAIDIAEATVSNVINRPIEVGEEVSFRVLMKAPTREGASISYWRLKAPDGVPFGHRLWCHVEVVKSASLYTTVLSAESLQQYQTQAATVQRFSERVRELRRNVSNARADNQAELFAAARQSTESRVKMLQNLRQHMMQMQLASDASRPPKPTVEEVPEEEVSATMKEQRVLEELEEVKKESAAEGSQMIFPVLEKESPISSTHEAAIAPVVSAPKTESVPASSVAAPSVADELEIFEDADTVDLVSESEDGFLTDEEYDVLDASDEEFVR